MVGRRSRFPDFGGVVAPCLERGLVELPDDTMPYISVYPGLKERDHKEVMERV